METERYERNSIRTKKKKVAKSQRLEGLNNKQEEISLIILELVFHGEVPAEMAEDEIPPSSKVPNEVRAARNNEAIQMPQIKLITQI